MTADAQTKWASDALRALAGKRLEDIPDDDALSRLDRVALAWTVLTGDADALRRILPRANGQLIGRRTSARKTAAVRENGKKGGRPRKVALPAAH